MPLEIEEPLDELDRVALKRLKDIEEGRVKDGGSWEEIREYLRKRGVDVDRLDS